MPRVRLGLAVAGALCSAGLLSPSGASAAVTASAITSPANDSSFFVDQTEGTSTATALTLTGSVTGTGNIDLDCVDSSGHVLKLATSVTPANGTFSVAVTQATLFNVTVGGELDPCVMRAVPAGTTPADPGVSSPFTGPDVAISDDTFYGTDYSPQLSEQQLDYFANFVAIGSGTTTGLLGFDSDASCGLTFSKLYLNNAAMTSSTGMFDCNGAIFDSYDIENTTTATPNGIEVDGHDGALADTYGVDLPGLPGWQPVAITDSYANGVLTIQDNEPVMLCTPHCGYGSQNEPTSLGATGVELDRTWRTADNGLEAFQTDVFRSTDGRAHAVTVDYDQNFGVHGGGAAVDFPGAGGFASPVIAQTVAFPGGANAIYLKSDAQTPDSGDGTDPQAAIVYARAPSGAAVTTYAQTSGRDEFYMPYSVSVPAGGSAVLRFAYVQDFALSDVKTLAQQALAGFNPALTISAPSDGATLAIPQTTISGTTTDSAGITSLTVDGTDVTLGSGGAFSDSVDLPVGANTITAVATDADGLTTTRTASVTVAKQTATSLGTKIKRGKHHRYTLTGKLKLPAGVSATQGCSGKITVTARRGRRKVGAATAKVSARCTWSARFRAKHLKRHGKLKVTVAFKGNAAIKPFTPKALKPKY
ncbi:MAG TPA: hypothetical protein VHU61_00945 [Solirubrobacteraceae bacterium]|nr:hypothetical protein [Solirubrobacteraceae bacterium]